jgi:hypothetical protein
MRAGRNPRHDLAARNTVVSDIELSTNDYLSIRINYRSRRHDMNAGLVDEDTARSIDIACGIDKWLSARCCLLGAVGYAR